MILFPHRGTTDHYPTGREIDALSKIPVIDLLQTFYDHFLGVSALCLASHDSSFDYDWALVRFRHSLLLFPPKRRANSGLY